MSYLRRAIEERDTSAVWRLLDEANDVNQPLHDTDGLTPLHLAARLGLLQVVYGLVVVYKADIEVTDAQGLTPLHHAAAEGRKDVVAYLLDHGTGVSQPAQAGETPLALAVEAGHGEVVELLLRRGARPSAPDPDGNALMHEAARRNWPEVVKLLLAREADIPWYSSQPRQHTARNTSGDTPLHTAVRAAAAEVARLLVSAGADPWATNDAGEKPIMLARNRNDEALRQAIAVGASARGAVERRELSEKDLYA